MYTPFRIAITGGIGCGKSYICRLVEEAGYPVFYCDDRAKDIIRTDTELQSELCSLVGGDLFRNGVLDKAMLAAYLCQGPDYSKQVDSLVHPRVAQAFIDWTCEQTADIVFIECALLFESGFDHLVDRTVCISVPESLRIQRVMSRDRVTYEKVQEWIRLQMPEEEKLQRADHVINNGPEEDVYEQLTKILNLYASK